MDKRQRERARKEKQLQKEQRRVERAVERQKRVVEGGKDADLKGIVPGPQPGQIIDFPSDSQPRDATTAGRQGIGKN
jgi:hypothetical protein